MGSLHYQYIHPFVPSTKYDYDPVDGNDRQVEFKFHSWDEFKNGSIKNQLLFLNRWFWIVTGKILALLYALGCALTIAAAAVAFICGLTGAMWPGVIAGAFMFIAGFVFNIKITWWSTPKVLLDFFGRGKLFRGLTEYFNRYGKRIKLNSTRKRWLVFGILCAVASAATWAAIGWGEIISAMALLLSVSATAVPPALLVITAVILAGLFVSTVAMLIKEMSLMLGKDDIVARFKTFWQKVKNVLSGRYFKDTFEQCKKDFPDKPKTAFIKQLLRDSRGVAIGLTMVGLTVAGLFMVMKTGASSLAEVFVSWKWNTVAANVVAGINCFLFAFSGELPFALGTSTFATKSINKWLNKKKTSKKKATSKPAPEGAWNKTKHYLKKLWRPLHITNGIGMGFIAMKTFMGNLVNKCPASTCSSSACAASPNIGMMTFAFLTGAIGSITAGFHGDEDDEEVDESHRRPKAAKQDKRKSAYGFNMYDLARKKRGQRTAANEVVHLLGDDVVRQNEASYGTI